MAAPATTTPPSESTISTDPKQQQQQEQPPPPLALPAPKPDATPKKRRLEEVGFHQSPYYKIRATIANLRGRFLQVCKATDSQKKDAVVEILKEIKVIVELSKKNRVGLYSVVEPMKPSVTPATTTSKDEPTRKIPSTEKNRVLPISLIEDVLQNTCGNIPLKADKLETAGKKLVSPVEIKKEPRTGKITDHTKLPGRVLQGSYVIGGSPIGCNFLMWPGSKVAYYGLTKAEWLARQFAKCNLTSTGILDLQRIT